MAAHVTTVSLITLALGSQAGPEKLCEPAVDECLCQPCVNGATCEDLVGHFACHCPAGYDGQLCQNDIDECQPNPCASGSTFPNRLGSFACQCPPGIVGRTCDLPVDPDFTLKFTSAGKLDYAVWDGGLRSDWKPLEQLTLCSWISTLDKQNYGTVFSYATDDEANSLTLTDYSGFVFYVNGANVVTDVTANDGQWHLICATWSSPEGQLRLYSDGHDAGTTDSLLARFKTKVLLRRTKWPSLAKSSSAVARRATNWRTGQSPPNV